jgi:pimeloyl-ACP methyl ester carboxylesterase
MAQHPSTTAWSIRRSLAIVALVLLTGCDANADPTVSRTPGPSTTAGSARAPSGSTPKASRSPRISLSRPNAPIDEPVSITLSGFEPNAEVTVRLKSVGTAFQKAALESFATFRSDAQGSVDLDTQKPVSGTYNDVDGMGLFWSMKEVAAEPRGSGTSTETPPDPVSVIEYRYSLTAEVSGQVMATTSVGRMMGSPDVTASEISANGVRGQFYLPNGPGPFPGVIVLVGSQGGLAHRVPKVVAAHGYAVLSLAYFGYTSPLDGSSLPTDTHELPLEYFGKAIAWLSAQPTVDASKIAMIGYSVGGQAALLTAANYPQVKSVVALSAPTYTWDWGESDSSFSFKGKPIPWADARAIDGLVSGFTDAVSNGQDPLPGMPEVVAEVKADPTITAALIPIERIQGSVLLVSGTNDIQLPGPVYGGLAIDRLKTHKFAYPYRLIIGQGAGHIVDFPYAPRLLEIEDGGGTQEANAKAGSVMWSALLEYLKGM